MNRIFITALAVLVFTISAGTIKAQNVAIKTNLLSWGVGTTNLGVEFALGRKTTLDITGAYNPWVFGNKDKNRKINHWVVKPEIRFWQWEKFNRGFIGVHAIAGSFNVGGIALPLGIYPDLKDYRFEGWMTGLGVSYGWQWFLSPHWSLEATIGFGYMYMEYNQFECQVCGEIKNSNVSKHYFGPTKLGLSFMYLFGSKK